MKTKLDRMWGRAWAIRDGRTPGYWLPIVQALALRGHPFAMIELAGWLSDNAKGRTRKAYLLCRRAYMSGEPTGAQNIAMDCFNASDLAGYRIWIRKAARAGDVSSIPEACRFDTRCSHVAAFRIRRGRPRYKDESYEERRPY